jgi:hypothetical protein
MATRADGRTRASAISESRNGESAPARFDLQIEDISNFAGLVHVRFTPERGHWPRISRHFRLVSEVAVTLSIRSPRPRARAPSAARSARWHSRSSN